MQVIWLLIVALATAVGTLQCDARQIVVDVGGHPGDFLALAALLKLNSPTASIRHITVHGNSAASLSAAYENVRSFIAMLGRSGDVNVYPGAAKPWIELPERRFADPGSPTTTVDRSIGDHRTPDQLPTCARVKGFAPFAAIPGEPTFEQPVSLGAQTWTRWTMDTLFGAADALPTPPPAPPSDNARDAVLHLLDIATDVEYIALGSLTNLADVLLAATEDRRNHLRVIHISGGSIQTQGELGKWLHGQAVLPGALGLDPADARISWNFFADPVAANFVLGTYLDPSHSSRYVYTLDATRAVNTAFTSSEFAALTTEAMKKAASLRAQNQRLADIDASVLEFIAALVQSQRVFADAASSSTAGAFSARYYYPTAAFVAMVALDSSPTGLRTTFVPREKRVTVTRTGAMTLSDLAGEITADESFVVDALASPSRFWDMFLATLGLRNPY